MLNQKIATIFYEIADMLEIKETPFKPQAYRKAAQTIEALSKDVVEIYRQGGRHALDEIPGVGKNLSDKIVEIIETGKCKTYTKLLKNMPMDFQSLMQLEGIGPKKIKTLYKKLNIKTVADLKQAAKKGQIAQLEGFGKKTEQNILSAISFSRSKKRLLLGQALVIANELINILGEAKYAGSLRRMKETIGDIDLLTTDKQVLKKFIKIPQLKKVLVSGTTKASVILEDNTHVDIRLVPKKSYGATLLYFTGSKPHNIALRRLAIRKGYKLSEYGLFSGKRQIAGATEKQVYQKLGLPYIPPEIRENTDEFQHQPKLITKVNGDLQMHTNYSDGSNSIEEMTKTSVALGHKYIAITDHTGSLKIAGAMSPSQIKKQSKEIDKLNKTLAIHILHGCEVNIRANNSLDLPNSILKNFDIVIAAIHFSFKKDNTDRLIAAMQNEHVDIIAHPTGRLINKRPPYPLNMEKIFQIARDTGTILEINADQHRLDLNDINIRSAIEHKCRLVINTDAHSTDALNQIHLGVATARRGWAENKDIINTLPFKRFLKHLKK
jgi:DNA polymerase (family 10)